MRGLSKSPEDRLDTCAKVLLAVSLTEQSSSVKILSSKTPMPKAAPAVSEQSEFPESNAAGVSRLIVFVLAAFAIFGGVVWYGNVRRQDDARERAVAAQQSESVRIQPEITTRIDGETPQKENPPKQIGEAEKRRILESVSISAINVLPGGEVAVGFTDSSQRPIVHYYIKVGESRDGWLVKNADIVAGTVTLEKEGVEVKLALGAKPFTPVRNVLAKVKAKITGYVSMMCFKSGDLVENGEVIMNLSKSRDSVQLRSAEVKLAMVEYRRAVRISNRMQEAGYGGITQNERNVVDAEIEKARDALRLSLRNLATEELDSMNGAGISPVFDPVKRAWP